MMDPFKSVLDIIRNFFNPPLEKSRKRRGSTVDAISSKTVRYSPYHSTRTRIIPIQRESDDSPWNSGQLAAHKKSPLQKQYRTPMKPLWPEDTVAIDDDDDVFEVKVPSPRVGSRGILNRFTSTPAAWNRMEAACENGDNDVILVKTTKSPKEKKEEAKLAGFSYIKPKSSPMEKPLFSIGSGSFQNGTKPKERRYSYLRRSPNASRTHGSLNYSFRLDDKMQYKKLLEQATNTSQNSSQYHTPLGKIFDSFNGRSASNKARSPIFSSDKSHGTPTVRETIMKVIDADPVVVVRDSDSEDSVVMISPPSPKPDIKVDPINSLKKIVDTSQASKKDWLDEVVERHKKTVEVRQREVDELRKYSDKTEEINKDINIELLRRKVSDCLQLKEVILPEISEPEAELPPLTEEHNRIVRAAFRGNANEILARKFNLNITRRDLMTLSGLNWLNDEVINFYMNLIIERGKDSRWPKSYAFNTFFYTKLLKDGPQSLRRWTKRLDIFDHDLVCVPIHLGMHWCMAIIDFRDSSIRYYDSMGSPNNRCLEALRNYLEAEYMDKKREKYDTSEFLLENMDNIPQQMNGSDCGMFACTFAEFITRNARITFKQEDMPYLRKKMVVEIITGEFLIK